MSSGHTDGYCDICRHWTDSDSIEIVYLTLVQYRPVCVHCKFAYSVYQSLRDNLMSTSAVDKLLLRERSPTFRVGDNGTGQIFHAEFCFQFQIVTTDDIIDTSLNRELAMKGITLSYNPIPLVHSPKPSTAEELCEYIAPEFKDCMESHDRCSESTRSGTPTFSPKRVLQLSASGVRLLEGASVNHWACLSYCWGTHPSSVKLTSQTFDTYRHGIPFGALPSLYQDAIKVCGWLNVQYLWIDALCIIQDQKDDWLEQASEMARIYAQGVFTIAADDSPSPLSPMLSLAYESFPWSPIQDFDSMYIRETVADVALKGEGSNDLFPPKQQRILNSRAWTYQETELSPRIIRFNRYEVVWECCEKRSRSSQLRESIEFYPNSGHLRLATIQYPPVWAKIVKAYSQRSLTIASDRLPALAAVAELFAVKSPSAGRYLAGLWEGHLIGNLLWERFPHHARPVPRLAPTPDGTSPTIPTWSWASVASSTHYVNGDTGSGSTSLAQVLDIDVQCQGSPYLGLTTKAAISLEARYMTFELNMSERFNAYPAAIAKWKIKGAPRVQHEVLTGAYDDLVDCFDYTIDAEEDEMRINSPVSGLKSDVTLILLLQLGNISKGLLLHRRSGCSSYRRIGHCNMWTRSGKMAYEWYSRNLAAGANDKDFLDKIDEFVKLCPTWLPLGRFSIE